MSERSAAKRRVRMPLSRGHMDVTLADDASPETINALRQLGEAAIRRMEDRMESTRCKFRCNSIIPQSDPMTKVVNLSAVMSDDDPESENSKFWTATPSGQLSMYINNPAGHAIFEQGKDYYLDITPA